MKYFECTYDWVESAVRKHRDRLRADNLRHVVGILRGGTVPAFVAAQMTDAELSFLSFSRETNQASWSGHAPPKKAKVLLVDDISGEGHTLTVCKQFLEGEGYAVKTLTVGYDSRSRLKPDYSTYFDGTVMIFPWERFRLNPDFVAAIEKREYEPDSRYRRVGLDLDGVLLPDLLPQEYEQDLEAALTKRDGLLPFPKTMLPAIDPTKTVIITARPQKDYDRTRKWLDAHGYRDLEVHCRDENSYSHSEAARYKAERSRDLGVTEYYESELLLATLMTNYCPLLEVFCWNNDQNLRIKLGTSILLDEAASRPAQEKASFSAQ